MKAEAFMTPTTTTNIKNYKELCSVFNLPYVSGNSKIYQLKELEKICRFHRDGRQYIIEEIYDTPKQIIKAPNKFPTAHSYVECVLPLFFSLFNDEHQLITNNSYLFQKIGFANENFGTLEFERNFVSTHPDNGKSFYSTKQYFYKEISKIIQHDIGEFKENGSLTKERSIAIKRNNTITKATPEEQEAIAKFKNKAFHTLNIKDFWEMKDKIHKVSYAAFKSNFCLKMDWTNFYYVTIYTMDPNKFIIHPFSDEEKEKMRKNINDAFINKVTNHGESKEFIEAILRI